MIGQAGAALAGQGRRLACWLPVGVGLGIAGYMALPVEPPASLYVRVGSACVIGLLLLVLARCWKPVGAWAAAGQIFGLCGGAMLTCTALGFLLAAWQAHRQPPMPLLPMESVWLEGQLSALAPESGVHEGQAGRWRLGIAGAVFDSPWWVGMAPLSRELEIKFQPRPGRMVLPEGLAAGDRVRMRVLLRPPGWPLWPGGHDGQRAAWFSGRAGAGMALSAPQVLPAAGAGRPLQARLTRLRAAVGREIMQALPGQRGAVAAAVLCGETGFLAPATRQAYAAAGLAHLLAVAGLHLGFVMALVFAFVRRGLSLSQRLAALWPCRELAMMVSLCAGAVYVVLTGAHLPGMRALGMAGLGVLACLLGRRVISLRSLALVALALELASPIIVLDVSFQMSMAAVMALIAGHEPLRDWLAELRRKRPEPVLRSRVRWAGRLLRRRGAAILVPLALTSLLAGLATLPLSMAYFGALQPWFVLANLLAVPLMGLWVMPAGLLALLLMPCGLAAFPLHVMGYGIGVIDALARHVAAAPLASWPVPSFPGWAVGLYLLGLVVLCLWRGRARFAGAGVMGVALLAVGLVPRPVLVLSAQDGVMVVRQAGGMRLVAGRLGGPLARDSLQRALGWRGRGVGLVDCAGPACRLPLGNGAVILWPRSGAVAETASGAAPGDAGLERLCRDVVLEVHADYREGVCPAVRHLGPDDVRRGGAWAVYGAGFRGVRLLSDRMVQGRRLWVAPEGFRGVPPLPLAQEE